MTDETPSAADLLNVGPPPREAWHRGHLLGMDIESTSVNPHTAHLLTCALVVLKEGQTLLKQEWLAHAPPEGIPEEASRVNKLTDEYCDTYGRPLDLVMGEVWGAIDSARRANAPIVFYNARYDVTLITSTFARLNMPPVEWPPIIDPLVIDKAVHKFRKGSRKLIDTAKYYRVRLEDAHEATGDTLMAMRIAWALAELYPELQVPPATLHLRQQQWAAEQALDLENYMKRQASGKRRNLILPKQWPIAEEIPLENTSEYLDAQPHRRPTREDIATVTTHPNPWSDEPPPADGPPPWAAP